MTNVVNGMNRRRALLRLCACDLSQRTEGVLFTYLLRRGLWDQTAPLFARPCSHDRGFVLACAAVARPGSWYRVRVQCSAVWAGGISVLRLNTLWHWQPSIPCLTGRFSPRFCTLTHDGKPHETRRERKDLRNRKSENMCKCQERSIWRS